MPKTSFSLDIIWDTIQTVPAFHFTRRKMTREIKVISAPTAEQLRPTPAQRAYIRSLFAWERRSAENLKDHRLGDPRCNCVHCQLGRYQPH